MVEQQPSPKAVVLTGEGKFFSNGLDLKWMAAHSPSTHYKEHYSFFKATPAVRNQAHDVLLTRPHRHGADPGHRGRMYMASWRGCWCFIVQLLPQSTVMPSGRAFSSHWLATTV